MRWNRDGMGWDGMGWDGMGWDGMGWDGVGWSGMEWDGMGAGAMGHPKSVEDNRVAGEPTRTLNLGIRRGEQGERCCNRAPDPGCWWHGDRQHPAGAGWEALGEGDPWWPLVPAPTGDLAQQGVEAVAAGSVEADGDRGGRVAERLGEAAAVDVILRQRL